MPYIKPERRPFVDKGQIGSFGNKGQIGSFGDINYFISTVLEQCLKQWGTSYETINGLVGVLECVKLELYRRVAAPYETQKMLENGDVYFSDCRNVPPKVNDEG